MLPMFRPRTLASVLAALGLAACGLMPAVQKAPVAQGPLKVQVLAINDFHGNLEPPTPFREKDPAHAGEWHDIPVGGAEALATAVKTLRQRNPNHVFVAAGDLTGGTPLLSALFHDEPTVEALSLMGLNISAVGNHEFDRGVPELFRRIKGGCHPKDGCTGSNPYKGATYEYLAASTIDTVTEQPLLPPYAIREFEGVKVAFIGLATKTTPALVMPSAIRGLRFDDEVATINKLVPQLRAQGIEAILVLIHEGGYPVGGYNECPGISGPIVDIVKKLDPAVDAVISGHTHRAYNCRIDGRLVTSGDKFGSMVTELELTIDRKTRDVVSIEATNRLVRLDQYAKDPEQTRLLKDYQEKVAPLRDRAVGRLAKEIRTGSADDAGAWPMGHLIADAQLSVTRAPENGGAQVVFMNTGGIRAGFPYKDGGKLTFSDVFTVQPFNNPLVTMTLSGAQILAILETQWTKSGTMDVLQVSAGFTYTWDAKRPLGQRVVPGSVMLNGEVLDPAKDYRVTVNGFIAAKGDGFDGFSVGRNQVTGMLDSEALEVYIKSLPLVQAPALDRIKRLN